jgi:glycosyltransferase involved in cell wall biosynthesis
MAKLRVAFLYTENMGVVWYRYINVAKSMRKEKGVEVAYSHYQPYDNLVVPWQYEIYNPITKQENTAIRSQLDMLCRCADVIVTGTFQYIQGLAWFAAAKDLFKKPFILQTDDYVLNPPEYNQAAGALRQGGLGEYLTVKQLNIADGVVCSTPYLAKLYSQYNANCVVVPNGQDFEIWDNLKKPKREENRKLVIGFAGSPNHVGDLKLVKDVLLQVLKENPNVELHLAGPEPEFFRNHPQIKFIDKWVNITEYHQALADWDFDIGIAPLKDNNLNRCKSNIRWQEYSSLKIPSVCTNIEHFKDSIKDGKTGYLVNNDQEWHDRLTDLIKSSDLRRSIGMKAYNDVKANWNIKNIAKDYIKVLQKFKKDYKAKAKE